MSRRRHRRRRRNDEFLRALRERADNRLPARAGSEETRPGRVDGGRPERSQEPVQSPEPKADRPDAETEELARRAAEAERLLAQARAAIEQEREARLATERRVRAERERAEREAAERQRAERDAAQHRPANGSPAKASAPTVVGSREIVEEPQHSRGPVAEPAQRVDAGAPPPLAQPSQARRPRAWLGLGRRSRRRIVCATCSRQLDGSPSDAAASGWEVNRKGRALCETCVSEGWHFHDGALLPMRRSTEDDASETPPHR